MPLYPIGSLRGMQFQGVGPRGPVPGHHYRAHADSEGSDDGAGDSDDGGDSDSVRSVQSPGEDLFDLDGGLRGGVGSLSQDFADYLQDDLHDDELAHQAEGSSMSDANSLGRSLPPTPPRPLAERLRDFGLDDHSFDDDLSDAPDYLAEETEMSGDSDSDGELSNVRSADFDDDLFEEVPPPPSLPAVSEERLQEAWPLGDTSFTIFVCPITHCVMTDPVVSADGYTYERGAIARWFETSRKSPVTGQMLPHTDLVPNQSVRTLLKTLIDMTEGVAQPSSSSASVEDPSQSRQQQQQQQQQQQAATAIVEQPSAASPSAGSSGSKNTQANGGSVGDRYCWSQTREIVEVNVFVPDGTKAKAIAIDVSEVRVSVIVGGVCLLEGEWEFKITPEEDPDWEVRDLSGRRAVRLTVRKAAMPGGLSVVVWWKRLLKGEPEIDLHGVEGRKQDRAESFKKAWEEAHIRFREKAQRRKRIPIDIGGEGSGQTGDDDMETTCS